MSRYINLSGEHFYLPTIDMRARQALIHVWELFTTHPSLLARPLSSLSVPD